MRQSVSEFRSKLDRFIAAGQPDGRLKIDPKGAQTLATASRNAEERMVKYGVRRFESVCRLMAVFQVARETERLDQRKQPVAATQHGAVWQAFGGNDFEDACHTCPTHLQLDGVLPTLITRNRGLQRYIVLEFADCVLMDRTINRRVDTVIDELSGKDAFAMAAELVLNEKGCPWIEAAKEYQRLMREPLDAVGEIVARAASFHVEDDLSRLRIDMLGAYHEGMYLRRIQEAPIDNLVYQIEAEMGRKS